MTTTTWTADAAHTDVQFSAKHMMVTTVRGKFTGITGTLTLDEAQPERSFGSFTIDATSLESGAAQRDGHLRSADFFDVEQYPTMTFVSTSVVAKHGNDYAVTGDLTIRDVTRPITFDVEYLGLYQGFQGRRAGFSANTKINREDWGLTWNVGLEAGGWLVGKEIKLAIELAMDEVVATPAVDASVTADESVAASA